MVQQFPMVLSMIPLSYVLHGTVMSHGIVHNTPAVTTHTCVSILSYVYHGTAMSHGIVHDTPAVTVIYLSARVLHF